MNLTITINDINNLTDTERAVLRMVAANPYNNQNPPDDTITPAIQVGQPVTDSTMWSYTPVAPAAPVAPVAPSGSADLDRRGIPWDKRIHASTRTKTQEGIWKYARGVDKLLVPQVEAELRAVQAIPVPVPTPAAAVTPPSIVPLPPTATLPMTFPQLMHHITPLLISGKLTQPMLQGVVATVGLPHLAALGARPDLVETVRAAIDEAVRGAQ